MKKLLILLALLLLLLAGIYYAMQSRGTQKVYTKDREFAIENTNNVGKIFVASRTMDPLTLTKKGKNWFVNDSLPANNRGVEATLTALRDLEIAYIPTKKAFDPIIKEIASLGVKVEVYDTRGKQMRSFYIGGTSPDGRATQMIIEGEEQPYMMKLKGRQAAIQPMFFKKPDDWRDPYLFREIYDNIDTLQLVYPRQKNQSFVLARSGTDSWNIKPYFETAGTQWRSVNKTIVQKYLYDVDKIAIEGFKNDKKYQFEEGLDRIPFCLARMVDREGSIRELRFNPLLEKERELNFKGNLFDAREDVVERLQIVEKDRDYFLGQFHLFSRFFWGYSFFFEQ